MVPVLRAVGGRTCTQLDSTCFQMRRRLKTIAATMSNAVIRFACGFNRETLCSPTTDFYMKACSNCMNSTVQNEHVTLNCGFASWEGIYSASLMTMELEHTTVIHLGNQWPFQPGPKRLVSGVAKTRAQLFRWMDENTGIRGILT